MSLVIFLVCVAAMHTPAQQRNEDTDLTCEALLLTPSTGTPSSAPVFSSSWAELAEALDVIVLTVAAAKELSSEGEGEKERRETDYNEQHLDYERVDITRLIASSFSTLQVASSRLVAEDGFFFQQLDAMKSVIFAHRMLVSACPQRSFEVMLSLMFLLNARDVSNIGTVLIHLLGVPKNGVLALPEKQGDNGFDQFLFELLIVTLALKDCWGTVLRMLSYTDVGQLVLTEELTGLLPHDEGDVALNGLLQSSSSSPTDHFRKYKFPWAVYVQLLWNIVCGYHYRKGDSGSYSALMKILLVFGISKIHYDSLFSLKRWHRLFFIESELSQSVEVVSPDLIHQFLIDATTKEDADFYFEDEPCYNHATDLEAPICQFVLGCGGSGVTTIEDDDDEDVITGLTPASAHYYSSWRAWVKTPLVPIDECRKPSLKRLWLQVSDQLTNLEHFYSLLELMSRIAETYFMVDSRDPAEELRELGTPDVEKSVLARAQKVIQTITGCKVGLTELYLMRILEAFDSLHGIRSELPGLDCPDKQFRQVLNLSDFLASCFIDPFVDGQLLPSVEVCVFHQGRERDQENGDSTLTDPSSPIVKAAYPTLLPDTLAKLLPAWFATKGNEIALIARQDEPGRYLGWRTLCLELMICASQSESPSKQLRIIAPHLNQATLQSLLRLYIDAGNPRAQHLFAKWLYHNPPEFRSP